MQEHKRWDLSHEPITAEHNQSYHITCPHSFSIAPHQTPPQALGGLLKLNGLRGVERCGLLLKLYLLGVAVAQIYFRNTSALNAFYVIFWNNKKKKCCTMNFFLIQIFQDTVPPMPPWRKHYWYIYNKINIWTLCFIVKRRTMFIYIRAGVNVSPQKLHRCIYSQFRLLVDWIREHQPSSQT